MIDVESTRYSFSYSVSGEAPKHPVVSVKSGSIFEKSLIEKYIAENGRDPTNNEEITVDDLVEIKSSKLI